MREVYLYRCDRCGTVVALNNDRGNGFYVDQCSACKEWSDYQKIVVDVRMGSCFMAVEVDDEV